MSRNFLLILGDLSDGVIFGATLGVAGVALFRGELYLFSLAIVASGVWSLSCSLPETLRRLKDAEPMGR